MVQPARCTAGARIWLERGEVTLGCEGLDVCPWGRVRVNQKNLPCPLLPSACFTVLEAVRAEQRHKRCT